MSVSREQANIPLELDAEPRLRLIGCRRAMGEKHDEIKSLCERAKERSIILDRMGSDEGKAHGRATISIRAVPSTRLPKDVKPSLGKRVQLERVERLSRIAALHFGDSRIA